MQNTHKITPHLWFDKEAKEASQFYTSIFKDSKIKSIKTITDTPSGDCDIVSFELFSQPFQAISAGPYFKFNPSISFFVVFDNEQEIDEVYKALSEGGTALMAYDKYPWAHKYGWFQDKYGLSWQLSWSDNHKVSQRITPFLMFTQGGAGRANDAIEFYTGVFPYSEIQMIVPYGKNEGDQEGFVKHARFTLNGDSGFMAMDSSGPHKFIFNEAVSFMVYCDTQEEIDHYWDALSAVPESEQCGWLKDMFGVSWQIIPTAMDEMMSGDDKDKLARVTQAFLKMKKFDIAKLKEAAEGK
jgi:predicted 3-demethylubiquinone-9 3-methyltransferase (glyoxalase superfamily)